MARLGESKAQKETGRMMKSKRDWNNGKPGHGRDSRLNHLRNVAASGSNAANEKRVVHHAYDLAMEGQGDE